MHCGCEQSREQQPGRIISLKISTRMTMTSRPGLHIFLFMLCIAHCNSLSSFQQDVAFSYIDTAGVTSFPANTYDAPPLLDRMGTGAVFTAPLAGTYVFTFHAGKNDINEKRPTDYKLVKVPSVGDPEVLLRLTVKGPAFGHTIVELEIGDVVKVETYDGTNNGVFVLPTAATRNPIIFNGFNVYHQCLCSPLVLRQSAFSASRTVDVAPGNRITINLFGEPKVNIHGDFQWTRGVFRATVPGIYVFMYSFPNSRTASSVTMNLLVNDEVKGTVTCSSAADRATQYAGTTVVVDLVEGDEVKLVKSGGRITYLQVSDGGVTFTASPIVFSGFLL